MQFGVLVQLKSQWPVHAVQVATSADFRVLLFQIVGLHYEDSKRAPRDQSSAEAENVLSWSCKLRNNCR